MPGVIGLLTGLITALFAYQFGVDGQRGSELLDWLAMVGKTWRLVNSGK